MIYGNGKKKEKIKQTPDDTSDHNDDRQLATPTKQWKQQFAMNASE